MSQQQMSYPIIRKFESRKIIPISVNPNWGADHADMQMISKYNKTNKIIVFYIYSAYVSVVTLKHKKEKICKCV